MTATGIGYPVVLDERGVRILKEVFERQNILMEKNKNVPVRSDFTKALRSLADAR